MPNPTENQSPRKQALLTLLIKCPGCKEDIDTAALKPGVNPGGELECNWCETTFQVPDVMVKIERT